MIKLKQAGFSYIEILIYLSCTMLCSMFFVSLTASVYTHLQKQKAVIASFVELFVGLEILAAELLQAQEICQQSPHEIIFSLNSPGRSKKWCVRKEKLMCYTGSYEPRAHIWHTDNAAVVAKHAKLLSFCYTSALTCTLANSKNSILSTSVAVRVGIKL